MPSLLLATLIGIFITPDGIVVGADTALSTPGGQVGSQQKYCVTGPRSVATMQGQYRLEDVVTKRTLELNNRFRDLCAELGASLSSMTLEQQARHIANVMQTDLIEFLERLPPRDVVSMYGSSPIVARIAVTGYGESGPESVVMGLGIAVERSATRWEARVSPLSRLTFSECGVRFQGHESVVSALRTDTGVQIPRAERQHTDVAKLATLLTGECGDTTIRSASAMFVQAVRLTVTLGVSFGIPQGAVSLPLDIVTIPRDGSIATTRVTEW